MEFASKLQHVKGRTWFYEFDLPGTRTGTNVTADVLPIQVSRRDKLVQIVAERVERPETLTAGDFGSHEGYYTVELTRHFRSVRGLPMGRRVTH